MVETEDGRDRGKYAMKSLYSKTSLGDEIWFGVNSVNVTLGLVEIDP